MLILTLLSEPNSRINAGSSSLLLTQAKKSSLGGQIILSSWSLVMTISKIAYGLNVSDSLPPESISMSLAQRAIDKWEIIPPFSEGRKERNFDKRETSLIQSTKRMCSGSTILLLPCWFGCVIARLRSIYACDYLSLPLKFLDEMIINLL